MSSTTEIKNIDSVLRQQITDVALAMLPISLKEMEGVKLMNRIDTKYVVAADRLPLLLSKAQTEYYIQEIDGIRLASYDTMYYDTDGLDMYIRHHDRQLVRQKIRIRRYVDSSLTFLEIKKKNNKGRTKKRRITLPEHQQPTATTIGYRKENGKQSEEGNRADAIKEYTIEDFIQRHSRYCWEEISPKLRTTFERITLVNRAKTERLTIDINLKWGNQLTGLMASIPNLIIIELKRDGNVPSPMLSIMREQRIRPLKISKYCIGTALTSPTLKQNRFKAKIRKIHKVLNTPA